MKIIVTLKDLLHRYDWDKACAVLGLDEWCLKEGTANRDDEITLTEEQAIQIGVINER